MSRKNKNGLWIVAASFAPLAHWAGVGWLTVAFAVAAVIPLCWLPGQLGNRGKVVSLLQWLWATAVLGSLIPAAGTYWTGGGKAVGLILLTLAALAGGTARRERGGNTLFWLLAPIFGLTLALAVGKLEWTWLEPKPEKWPGELLCILLLPALASCREENGTPAVFPLLSGLTAMTAALLIQGSIGQRTAAMVSAPLYETGRALGPGGEILISVGMTLSWYGFASLLFGKATEFAKEIGLRQVWAAGITWILCIIMVLLTLKLPGAMLAAGSLLLWVILPLCPARKIN